MAEFNYYLKSQSDDRETPINLYVRYKLANKTETVKVSTGQRILPSRWNSSTKKPRRFEGSPELDSRLTHISTLAQDVFRKYLNDNEGNLPQKEELKTLIVEVLRPDQTPKEIVVPLSFFQLFEVMLEERKTGTYEKAGKSKPYSQAAIDEVRILRDKVNAYAKSKKLKAFGFDDVTLAFYKDFTTFLRKKDYSTNYIGKLIKCLKMVMGEGVTRKLHNNLDFKHKDFSKISEDTPQIYLSIDELRHFEKIDLSNNKRLDRARDMLILGAWTGLRFSDFSTVKKTDIILNGKDGNSYIKKETAKTGGHVAIPIFEPVMNLLNKYRGLTPNSLPVPITNQRFNDYIKELGEIIGLDEPIERAITKGGKLVKESIPKYKALGSHVCRRSFATNLFKLKVPIITIMAVTGHKTESEFLRYIRETPEGHADEMFRIVNPNLRMNRIRKTA